MTGIDFIISDIKESEIDKAIEIAKEELLMWSDPNERYADMGYIEVVANQFEANGIEATYYDRV